MGLRTKEMVQNIKKQSRERDDDDDDGEVANMNVLCIHGSFARVPSVGRRKGCGGVRASSNQVTCFSSAALRYCMHSKKEYTHYELFNANEIALFDEIKTLYKYPNIIHHLRMRIYTSIVFYLVRNRLVFLPRVNVCLCVFVGVSRGSVHGTSRGFNEDRISLRLFSLRYDIYVSSLDPIEGKIISAFDFIALFVTCEIYSLNQWSRVYLEGASLKGASLKGGEDVIIACFRAHVSETF